MLFMSLVDHITIHPLCIINTIISWFVTSFKIIVVNVLTRWPSVVHSTIHFSETINDNVVSWSLMRFRIFIINVLTRLTRVKWMVKCILTTLLTSHHQFLSKDPYNDEDHWQHFHVICTTWLYQYFQKCTCLLNCKFELLQSTKRKNLFTLTAAPPKCG